MYIGGGWIILEGFINCILLSAGFNPWINLYNSKRFVSAKYDTFVLLNSNICLVIHVIRVPDHSNKSEMRKGLLLAVTVSFAYEDNNSINLSFYATRVAYRSLLLPPPSAVF